MTDPSPSAARPLRPTPTPPVPLPPTLTAKTALADEPAAGRWNTHKLGLRIGADALAAGSAGALVAPVITMIDKGIIENASGRDTLGGSLRSSARELLTRPWRFVGSRPFALIFVSGLPFFFWLLVSCVLEEGGGGIPGMRQWSGWFVQIRKPSSPVQDAGKTNPAPHRVLPTKAHPS